MFLIGSGKKRAARIAARSLYERAVAQSRAPAFYERLGVPDSLDGRFDMVALHVFLLLHRLRQEGPAAKYLAQALFDTMFDDMDDSLRELGVGDLSVGRKVKSMAKALYGRIAAYEEGLATGDTALGAALGRNLFRHGAAEPGQLAAFCAYLRREAAALDTVPLATLSTGLAGFGPVPEMTSEIAADPASR